MPAPLNLSGPCKICDQPAHGRHFGVLSCRACAAFFRRAARISSKSQDIICEQNNCKVSDSGVFTCKACRLKKCLAVGMDSRKFQSDRDLLSSSWHHQRSKLSTPQSLSNFLGRPEVIIMCEPDKASTSKTIVNVSFLVDRAVKVVEEPPNFTSPRKFQNSLEQMTLELENVQISQMNLEFQTKVGQIEMLTFWENTFIKTAKWFSKFPEFRELPMDVKIEVLKSSWNLWIRLEKHAETAKFHRKQLLGADVFVTGEGKCMNLKSFDIDMSFCTNYSMDQLRALMVPDIENLWKPIVDGLVKLDPTNVELNFMLIQLCLSDAQKKLNGEIRESLERLLAIQADNLHHYYTKTMKTPSYSGRLSKMMKIIQMLESDARMQREKASIARIFDVFTMEFSHPEMFDIF